jgi:hypothetical protein
MLHNEIMLVMLASVLSSYIIGIRTAEEIENNENRAQPSAKPTTTMKKTKLSKQNI